jgi:hypothetical protein
VSIASAEFIVVQETLSAVNSRASDVFMFGMLICETVTGNVPFADIDNLDTVSAMIKAGNRLARPAGVDGALWAIAERCFAQQPAQCPTAEDVAAALADLMRVPNSAAPRGFPSPIIRSSPA